MATVTFPGVEIAAVGRWNASAGDGHITREDLASMVDTFGMAGADNVPIKIGHLDSRFQDSNGRPPVTADGQPSFGWVARLRLSPDGQKLIGDLVGIPSKLAEMLPSAYRRRSIEMLKGMRIGGSVRRAVLSAVALLGVTAPAIKGLGDVAALFGAPVHFAAAATPAASPDDGDARALGTYARSGELVRVDLSEPDPDLAATLRWLGIQ